MAVLAGGGSNGGGAICAVRHLANRNVALELCVAEPERMTEASSLQLRTLRSTRGQEIEARHVRKSAIKLSSVAQELPDSATFPFVKSAAIRKDLLSSIRN